MSANRYFANEPILPHQNAEVYEADRLDRFLRSLKESRHKPDNLWGEYDGQTISIFKNRYGNFQWSIDDGDGITFSKRQFDGQVDAARALLNRLQGRVD